MWGGGGLNISAAHWRTIHLIFGQTCHEAFIGFLTNVGRRYFIDELKIELILPKIVLLVSMKALD
jgi:hypothetical protein